MENFNFCAGKILLFKPPKLREIDFITSLETIITYKRAIKEEREKQFLRRFKYNYAFSKAYSN